MNRIDEKELKQLFTELKSSNNKVAFEKLYSKYNKLIYSIAFSILKNKTDSEDIVQTVFTKLYTMSKDKFPIQKQASWLYSLTKNETISFLRKKKHNIDLESIYEIEDRDNEINNIIDQIEFNRLISKLNDKEKQVVSLKILVNLSFEEIGKLLDVPTGTVKWRYYKSIHTLKILLSNLGMFIITFVMGIKLLSNQNKSNRAEQKTVEDNSIEKNQEKIENETTKSETQDSLKEEMNNVKEEIEENTQKEIQEEISIQEPVIAVNNYAVGILSFSAIFLTLTIIFSIIFTKYQLKANKKRLNSRKVKWWYL